MLAVVAAEDASLDAGSVALAVARRWSDSGERVLLVDADASGSRLAQRLGEAARADYSPAERGMPSLIVAREPVTLKLLADHCYSLDTSDGSLWALFAPTHPAGAQYAARWLAERAGDLMAVTAQRRVVVSATLGPGAEPLAPLLSAAPIVAVLSPAESLQQVKSLWTRCHDAGLLGLRRKHRALVVEGESPLSDEDIAQEAAMQVAGRLPVIDDDRVLRLQGGRRDRAFLNGLDEAAGRLLGLLNLVATEDGPAPASQQRPAGLHLDLPAGAPALSTVNGGPARLRTPGPAPAAVSETER